MPLRLVLLVYNSLLPFALLAMLPGSLLKMRRRGGYGSRFGERFGRFRHDVLQRLASGGGKAWWLHAVSVGEVNVARKLISEILKREPHRPLVLSVTTSTGRAVAEKDAPPQLTVIYSPVDLPRTVRRVLSVIQPEKLALVEAEVWPNLLYHARRRNIPVALVNARLSPRSGRRFQRFRAMAGPVFAMLDRVLVQDQPDIARWVSIGVRTDSITCTGSMKYDLAGTVKQDRVAEFRAILTAHYGTPLPPVIMAASTHRGEEKALAETFCLARQTSGQRAVIAIAPRHFERAPEIVAALSSAGLTTTLRSSRSAAPGGDVYLIDSTGELRDWQALASVVIMGKSFLAHGGQNPAEAIAAGVPVITGPNMENFLPLMDLLQRADGIATASSLPDLEQQLAAVLQDPRPAQAQAARGLAALEKHRGATARSYAELAAL